MLNITLNILIKRYLKVLIIQTFILEKGQKRTYLYIYYFKFTFDILQQVLLNKAVEVAILIYLVLDIQNISRDFHNSYIIYWVN